MNTPNDPVLELAATLEANERACKHSARAVEHMRVAFGAVPAPSADIKERLAAIESALEANALSEAELAEFLRRATAYAEQARSVLHTSNKALRETREVIETCGPSAVQPWGTA